MRSIFATLAKPFTQTAGLARWMLVIGVLLTSVFVVCAVFAPWLAPYGFAQASSHGVPFPKVAPPSSQHLFGTDRLFFDVFSRVIWGARTALEVVILSIVVCVVVGVPLGIVSGYYGGWLDRILVLIMDALYAFPSFLLAIVFSFLLTNLLGGTVVAVSLSLSVVGHTDNVGGADANLKLSRRRADAVVAALVEDDGIDEARLESSGAGMTKPVASNDDEQGRAKNRRVELVKR